MNSRIYTRLKTELVADLILIPVHNVASTLRHDGEIDQSHSLDRVDYLAGIIVHQAEICVHRSGPGLTLELGIFLPRKVPVQAFLAVNPHLGGPHGMLLPLHREHAFNGLYYGFFTATSLLNEVKHEALP